MTSVEMPENSLLILEEPPKPMENKLIRPVQNTKTKIRVTWPQVSIIGGKTALLGEK